MYLALLGGKKAEEEFAAVPLSNELRVLVLLAFSAIGHAIWLGDRESSQSCM
jgi:hypothetical protein